MMSNSLQIRSVQYVWSATGGEFEWALILGSTPSRSEYECLQGTLELALETIKRGMLAKDRRFTGFDGIEYRETSE